MTEELEALGRRAVACKGWRLLPGCPVLARYSGTIDTGLVVFVDSEEDGGKALIHLHYSGRTEIEEECGETVPDLSDPATLGCLLALVREAWDDPTAHTVSSYYSGELMWECDGWSSALLEAVECKPYQTEAEALVAALEAAP